MFNLLVVDDEWVIRDGLKHTVPWEEWNIKLIQTAKSGDEALEIIANEHIDILLTDIRMPGLSGLELIEKIKQLSSDINIIILTGHNEFNYAQQALRLQINDFLLKPTDFRELEKVMKGTVDEIKQRQRQKKELLSLQINRLISHPSLANVKTIENIAWFQPFYRMIKIELPTHAAIDRDIFLNKVILVKSEKNIIFMLLYHVHTEEQIQEIIQYLTSLFVTKEGPINIFISQPVKNHDQIVEIYNQANVATDLVSDEDGVRLYEYRVNDTTLKMEEVIAYIRHHYDKPISQQKIAEKLYMSNSHFSKLFKQKTGEKFSDFLTNVRLNEAKALLLHTKLKTYEIANEVGYSEPKYFSQTFKKHNGVTPGEFRNQKCRVT